MKLRLGPEIIGSYKRLSYTPWYALAEFVDNSTQAYFDNKEELDKVFKKQHQTLEVEIEHASDDAGEYIRIRDNSIGMSDQELNDAVIVGKPPRNPSGRSKYGLGLKTAACWFGDFWTITTKKLGDKTEHYVEIDVPKIAAKKLDLNHREKKVNSSQNHYTIITIRNLHTRLAGRTKGKVKDYLRSMYRLDFKDYGLKLLWQGEQLDWNLEEEVFSRLIINENDEKVYRKFKFKVGKKIVSGWAGVFERGSRRDAGFSVIQAKRVIIGWPESFRPETLFGDQAGGRNDLINQRLVGEIYLDGFDVSHTKDNILFSDDERDELEGKLEEEIGDLKQMARSYRKYKADQRVPTDVQCDTALNEFEMELKSNELNDILFSTEIPSKKLLKENNNIVKNAVISRADPSIKAKIGELNVYLYVVDDMSPNDPYVIIDSTRVKSKVIVIVNKAHPHWIELKDADGILNYLRHCTYDGVAEWKAYFKAGDLDPDTVKKFKDDLLRLPFEIERHIRLTRAKE